MGHCTELFLFSLIFSFLLRLLLFQYVTSQHKSHTLLPPLKISSYLNCILCQLFPLDRLIFLRYLLFMTCSVLFFTCIISLKLHSNSTRKVELSLLYRKFTTCSFKLSTADILDQINFVVGPVLCTVGSLAAFLSSNH